MARASNWRLEPAGVTRWGENSEANYAAYIAFLVKNGVLKEKVDVGDIVTNELIDDINKFDAAAIATMAKNYKRGIVSANFPRALVAMHPKADLYVHFEFFRS